MLSFAKFRDEHGVLNLGDSQTWHLERIGDLQVCLGGSVWGCTATVQCVV